MADALRCELANALSCLMVCGSEELVSKVIRIRVKDGAHLRFPVTVVVPFCGSYRGSYRDVVMKMVDKEGRRSYVAPLATEGTYGGQWVKFCSRCEFGITKTSRLNWSAVSGHVTCLHQGSFAEVRVYCLGLFAVVSCLKKENYTVPTKGLSLKLNMDPRICLNYLPGCFAAPVIAQTMVHLQKYSPTHLMRQRGSCLWPVLVQKRTKRKGQSGSQCFLRSSRWTRPFWLLPSPGQTPTIQWSPPARFSTSPIHPLSPWGDPSPSSSPVLRIFRRRHRKEGKRNQQRNKPAGTNLHPKGGE